ncbi:IclR family transcriptional regulator [Fodinicurvata sp. EGI_FJ10296]|uniref:IclR family transcriptional regulator n=1 Tax=Fodinicurvata sp. EGI_FJ10296 TaxID=3231908 RepID=UPI00345603D6
MKNRDDDSSELPAAAPARDRAGGQVQSLGRALTLLEHLARRPDGRSLSDLAAAAELAPSTVHRLLKSLESRGFAAVDADTGLWCVGIAAFTVGNAFLRGRSYIAVAQPHMRSLAETTGETINLAVPDHGAALYVAQIESQHMMRVFARMGTWVPLHCSGVGKAILIGLSAEDRSAMIRSRIRLTRLTDRTLTEPEALARDLAAAEARGYAIDDGEHAVGLRCVAAPIFDNAGMPLAAVSVSGPAARVTDERVADMGAAVAATAASITARLGGRRGGGHSGV